MASETAPLLANNTDTASITVTNNDSYNNGNGGAATSNNSALHRNSNNGHVYEYGSSNSNTFEFSTQKIDNQTWNNNNNKSNDEDDRSSLLQRDHRSIQHNNHTAYAVRVDHSDGDDDDAKTNTNSISNNIGPITPIDYYYNSSPANKTIQRYYRFTASKATPFIALYKRPLETYPDELLTNNNGNGNINSNAPNPQSDTTGLLTRSMVLPSHGTDPSGRWILVSVGGRTGWARRSLLFPLLTNADDNDDGNDDSTKSEIVNNAVSQTYIRG